MREGKVKADWSFALAISQASREERLKLLKVECEMAQSQNDLE